MESSIPGIYAGGDVADDGPSSIVKAAADGKRAAEAIIARAAVANAAEAAGDSQHEFDLHQLLQRRAHREWRVPVEHTPLDDRLNFNDTIITYSPEEAMAEASRCLDCHQICSLCVGACPNMALMTYESDPFTAQLPSLTVERGEIVAGEVHEFSAGQEHQIAVLTDFCNECGNCVTFCPTSGEPYRDKPRLYLDRADFEAQSDNAFMLLGTHGDGRPRAMEARWAGESHRIEIDESSGDLLYFSPSFAARIDPIDFSLLEATPDSTTADGHALSLEPCASMHVVLDGLRRSMPHLPVAPAPNTAAEATKIAHPGYQE